MRDVSIVGPAGRSHPDVGAWSDKGDLANPYSLERGAPLRLRLLVDGQPVANQYVVSGGRTLAGGRIAAAGHRSDSAGIVHIPMRAAGQWYVKFIHMVKATGDTTVDYESKWASLTFEVRPGPR